MLRSEKMSRRHALKMLSENTNASLCFAASVLS